MRAIKALVVFWLAIIPLAFLALIFGPAYTSKPMEPSVERHCDSACMDKLLAP